MRRISTVMALATAVIILNALPAAASCAPPPPIEEAITDAELVFVGTVIGLADDDRTARFEVEEVWKGALDAVVTVHGGPGLAEIEAARAEGQTVFTSVDRTYDLGVRYLVVPYNPSGPVPSDNACTPTAAYRAEFDALRPETVLFPEPAAPDGEATAPGGIGLGGWLAIGVAAIAIVGAGTLIITRDTGSGFTPPSEDGTS